MPAPADPPRPSVHDNADETASITDESPASPVFGPPSVPGDVGVLGRYRVVKQLGHGGMGSVYAALDTRLGRPVALKVMLPKFAADPDARERFLREARAAAQIKHDNVVTVYEADERDDMPYIAMEFLEGYSLDRYLKQKGNPTIPQILRIGRETAVGLAAAHKIGLVHRDIKPGNLWLEAPDGRIKVLDFGLAKPLDAEVDLTKSGAVVGTPAYMSPEQARGQKVDHRSDLFSLGAVLYRLCAGRSPFHGPNTMAVLMALGTDEPVPVRERNPHVPEPLAELIHQLLAKNPADRPQSADVVAQRIRAMTEGAPGASAVMSQPQVVYVPIHVTAVPEGNPFTDLTAPATAVDPDLSGPNEERPAVRTKPGRSWLWPAIGLAAVLAVVVVVVIAVRSQEAKETKGEPPDATARGPDVKTPTPRPSKKAPADTSPDRKAAEWVLSLGGTVHVNGEAREIKTAVDLPEGRFALTWVDLDEKPVDDAGLARLKGCTGLQVLWLNATPVSDAGLEHLKSLPALAQLDLNGTRVTDGGAAVLKDFKGLTQLDLSRTRVTDAGVAYLKECKGLQHLFIHYTGITDGALAHLKGCEWLTRIGLDGTAVTDTGLAHLKELKVVDRLTLDGTKVTDAGLVHLKELKGLMFLSVRRTSVTAKGIQDFATAAPGCKIESDGATIVPTDIERPIAERVLASGGSVRVNRQERDITEAAELPKDRIRVTRVMLNGRPATDDTLLALSHLKELTELHLLQSRVTDAGVAHIKDLTRLTTIHLGSTRLTDAGLADLKALDGLTWLHLADTKVTDNGLLHLRGMRKLATLSLYNTAVTDAGLARLKEFSELKSLDLRRTNVTAKGIEEVRAAVPKCRIVHDGGTIEPSK